jgi:hypothetical protein
MVYSDTRHFFSFRLRPILPGQAPHSRPHLFINSCVSALLCLNCSTAYHGHNIEILQAAYPIQMATLSGSDLCPGGKKTRYLFYRAVNFKIWISITWNTHSINASVLLS